MSGSTAAAVAATPVTSNGASLTLDAKGKPDARRRTMVIVEKTLNADGLSAGGTNGVANGKDLSHTIRGESVIERPKDYSKLKKRLIASSTVSPRRKKAVPKPEKPKWQTVLSVLTKNCLLLAALLWLGQTVWRWSYSIGDNANSPFASLDYESRIYDVEASIKETAKMLQVQLDVVDKKIGSEIGIVTRELLKQAEEKGALVEEELKKLEAKTDSLDKSLGELKDKGLLSREEFEKLLNGLDDSNINLDLDQIRAFARDIVQKEIEKHAADGLGRVDYALASGGAKVVRHSEPYGFGKGNSWFAKGHNGVHANAHKMLEPSFGEPGQCFPLQGSSGFVELRLRTGIIPEAVTLEHVAKVRVGSHLMLLITSFSFCKLLVAKLRRKANKWYIGNRLALCEAKKRTLLTLSDFKRHSSACLGARARRGPSASFNVQAARFKEAPLGRSLEPRHWVLRASDRFKPSNRTSFLGLVRLYLRYLLLVTSPNPNLTCDSTADISSLLSLSLSLPLSVAAAAAVATLRCRCRCSPLPLSASAAAALRCHCRCALLPLPLPLSTTGAAAIAFRCCCSQTVASHSRLSSHYNSASHLALMYTMSNRNFKHNKLTFMLTLVKSITSSAKQQIRNILSSAPKDCRVSAWFESPDEDPSSNIKKIVMLTEFSYDLEKSNAQTFDVEVGDAGVVINTVRLDFTSNHGSSALTCIYRFRVHGHEPSSPAAMGLQG
ncbi:unnamed protein product [Musa acuminata subsp. burmannicoides]